MSTPERAREHLDAARLHLAAEQPSIQNLAKARLVLKAWEGAARTLPEGHGRDTARALTATGYLVASWAALERAMQFKCGFAYTDPAGYVKAEALWQLGYAALCLTHWEAESEPVEARDEPESARDRVGGKSRSAAICRACKCLDHIEIAECADAVWRETLAREAALPCARHAVEREREWRSDAEIKAEHARTLEVLTDEWEVKR